ncbi:hypothetical protein BPTFM16_01342 [Altererythrobacter insulae]|nr:hypothetical protein BPTFM16_01342 [Altererythrobacter insulae]
MIQTLLSPLLLLAASSEIEPVVWIGENRVRVSAEIRNSNSPREHANAQIKLMRLAKKACKEKGAAVSEGTLNVDSNPNGRGLIISEVYVCTAE